jgi:hypothetical protein
MLKQIEGKWVLVSRKTQRPLAYYKGEGKPSEEWVQKQEKRIQYFKHMHEDYFGIGKAVSPFIFTNEYKKALEDLKNLLKRKKDKRHDALYYASIIAKNHPHVNAKKLVKMIEHQELTEAAYVGNLGIMELIKFQKKASQKQKDMLQYYIQNKQYDKMRKLIADFTNVKLHKSMHESLEDHFSRKNPPPMHIVIRNYYHLTDKGYKEHEIRNHFNKHFGMKLKKGDIERHIVKNLHAFKEEIKPDILPKSGAGQWGTDELVKTYTKDTPGQSYKKFRDYIK